MSDEIFGFGPAEVQVYKTLCCGYEYTDFVNRPISLSGECEICGYRPDINNIKELDKKEK